MVPDLTELDVSRETFDRLERYVALLEKWTPKINLIAKSTVPLIWSRHIMDSLEVYRAGPLEFDVWLDLGSGAGLPGLVVAVMAHENPAQHHVRLVESDQRKAAFLRSAARETGVDMTVLPQRIEVLAPQKANVVSARALASLTVLLGYAAPHLEKDGVALFSKGVNWEKELVEARSEWSFSCEPIKSETEEGSVILRIGDITRV